MSSRISQGPLSTVVHGRLGARTDTSRGVNRGDENISAWLNGRREKLRFRVGDLDLAERRKRNTDIREEEEVDA